MGASNIQPLRQETGEGTTGIYDKVRTFQLSLDKCDGIPTLGRESEARSSTALEGARPRWRGQATRPSSDASHLSAQQRCSSHTSSVTTKRNPRQTVCLSVVTKGYDVTDIQFIRLPSLIFFLLV